MKLLLILLASLTAISCAAEESEAVPRWRTLDVNLLDTRGKPAPGVKVDLRGLDRGAIGVRSEKPNPGWEFTSDARGKFTVRFGRFRTYDSEKIAGYHAPGWGAYHLVAETAAGHAAVSGRLLHPSEDGAYGQDVGHPEWSGRSLRLRAERTSLTMRLRQGLKLTGQVIGTDGRPWPGCTVSVVNDLGAGSHTGYGGEILSRAARTDEAGNFIVPDIYPNKFYVAVRDEARENYWVRTQVRHRAIAEIVDAIVPRPKERAIRLRVVLSPEKPCRYFGRITASEGRPVAGAKVTVGVSFHRELRTHQDDHHFIHAETDAEGRYEALTESRFVHAIRIEAPGFLPTEWPDGGQKPTMAAPGKHDFVLRPTP